MPNNPDAELLKTYIETKYVSKNEGLRTIVKALENKTAVRDDLIYSMLREKRWNDFDNYLLENKGEENFFRILQQLLMFKYFLPDGEKISEDTFQNAMGVQQVRWSHEEYEMTQSDNTKVKLAEKRAEYLKLLGKKEFSDGTEYKPEYEGWPAREAFIESLSPEQREDYEILAKEFLMPGYTANMNMKTVLTKEDTRRLEELTKEIKQYSLAINTILEPLIIASLKFFIWDNIPDDIRINIIRQLKDSYIDNSNVIIIKTEEELSRLFEGSVWYELTNTGKITPPAIAWNGFGDPATNVRFYPIPQTLCLLTSFTIFYQPQLVFGSLSDKTLFKFQIYNNKRPYAAYCPKSSNLYYVHDHKQILLYNWMHDFSHQTKGQKFRSNFPGKVIEGILKPDLFISYSIRLLFALSKRNDPDMPVINDYNDIKSQLDDSDSKLNKILNNGEFVDEVVEYSETRGIRGPEGRPMNIVIPDKKGEAFARLINDKGLVFNNLWADFPLPENLKGGRLYKIKKTRTKRKNKRITRKRK